MSMRYFLCCMFVGLACLIRPTAAYAVDNKCSFNSLTECFLKELGPPRTQEEWLLAYTSALAETCLRRTAASCHDDARCILVTSPQERVELGADAESVIDKQVRRTACRPNLFRLLSQPCKGSRGDLLARCGGHATAEQCNKDKPCIWLRNGWWYEPGSRGQKATLFSGEAVDTSVALQGGVPASRACWPKWHLPYAAQNWPHIQLKPTTLLACPVLASDYPCTIYTNASLQAKLPVGGNTHTFPFGVVDAAALAGLSGLSSGTTLADVLSSAVPCIDVLGIKGKCPHVDLASLVVAQLWKAWEVPVVLHELYTNNTPSVADDCIVMPVDEDDPDGHSVSQSNLTVRMTMTDASGTLYAWFEALTDEGEAGALGALCMLDGCKNKGSGRLDLGKQCVSAVDDQGAAPASCITSLVSVGLWDAFAAAVLGPRAAPRSPQGSLWLSQPARLAEAGELCGTLEDWHEACSSKVDSLQNNAFVSNIVREYERLFLFDARAAQVPSASWACKQDVAAAYTSLAAVWVAYASVLVLGLAGLVVFWSCRGRCCWRRSRKHAMAAAWHSLLTSIEAQQPAATIKPVVQQQPSSPLRRAVRWAYPRTRAVSFVVDFGLDVYTLALLWSTRWFKQLLLAVLFPHMVMALLVAPGFGHEGRLAYAGFLLPVFCCSSCFWPAIWWLDLRMVFSLLGVQLPCCGESRLVMALYTDLRLLFEGVFEALLSALVSTAVLYDKLAEQSSVYVIPTAILWLNLVSSFIRGAVEIWKLAVLTHSQGNWCFMTTIANMVWDMMPPRASPTAAAGAAAAPGACGPNVSASTCATVAPQPLSIAGHPLHSHSVTINNTTQGAECKPIGEGTAAAPAAAAAAGAKAPEDTELQHGCECCCSPDRVSGGASGANSSFQYRWMLTWVWLWVSLFGILTVLLFVSTGCVGLLVQDGFVNLGVVVLPRYRFAGDVTCGAGSLFGALHSGGSVSCTLPNLVAA